MELKFGFGGGGRKSVFSRVDTINLVSARNGKVGGIYFLIVMLVYGATVLLGRDLFSHGYGFLPWHTSLATWEAQCRQGTELDQSWSWWLRSGARHTAPSRWEAWDRHQAGNQKSSHLLEQESQLTWRRRELTWRRAGSLRSK